MWKLWIKFVLLSTTRCFYVEPSFSRSEDTHTQLSNAVHNRPQQSAGTKHAHFWRRLRGSLAVAVKIRVQKLGNRETMEAKMREFPINTLLLKKSFNTGGFLGLWGAKLQLFPPTNPKWYPNLYCPTHDWEREWQPTKPLPYPPSKLEWPRNFRRRLPLSLSRQSKGL